MRRIRCDRQPSEGGNRKAKGLKNTRSACEHQQERDVGFFKRHKRRHIQRAWSYKPVLNEKAKMRVLINGGVSSRLFHRTDPYRPHTHKKKKKKRRSQYIFKTEAGTRTHTAERHKTGSMCWSSANVDICEIQDYNAQYPEFITGQILCTIVNKFLQA